MTADLDVTLDSLLEAPEVSYSAVDSKIESNIVPAPTEEEMNSFYAELNSCKFKRRALCRKAEKFPPLMICQTLNIRILNIQNCYSFALREKKTF